MDWQQPAALAVVAFTGFLFVRREIRSRRRSHDRACGNGECACGAPNGAGEPRPPAGERDVESHTPMPYLSNTFYPEEPQHGKSERRNGN